ncbi:MAG TPA: Hsp20/alpha crystallin family protein [Bacteroides sp.]|nr:Hsp20/alpha crystallin family protein [Bacteroides sp.]
MALARLSDNVFPSFPSMFERFFEGDMMDWNGGNFADRNATLPAVNVIENDDEYRIEVAAPGLKKSDFNLNFENGRLTISSERKDERQEKSGDRFNRREFWYQSFQRSFTLPENVVNTGKISARYEDGILYITLPKRDEVKPKPAKAIKIT